MNILDGHKKAVLHFSGGKDSLACLYLLKDYWHKIEVHWVNTGAAIDETIEQMKTVKAMVPNFLEIKSNQPEDIEKNGIPVDVLPVKSSREAAAYNRGGNNKMRLYYECCSKNIWAPAFSSLRGSGATLLIRGQKNSDTNKPPLKSGDIVDGIELFYPIESWSDSDVSDFLAENNVKLPSYYSELKTSMDCWSCTAFAHENGEKLRYFDKHDKDKAKILRDRLTVIAEAVEEELINIRNMIG